MCEHEFKMFVSVKRAYPGFAMICIHCHKTQREIDLEQQLTADVLVADREKDGKNVKD